VKERACVDVCPVGAICSAAPLPDGSATTAHATDHRKRHDHTFLVQHSRNLFAD
jgi:hypothetical protein